MSRFRSFLALSLASAGCVTQTVPESTTTVVGPNGGTAYSADGAFSLAIPPGALSADVSVVIDTDRVLGAPGQITPVYRVSPRNLAFAQQATAMLRVGGAWTGELLLGSPEDGPRVGAYYDNTLNAYVALVGTFGCDARPCAGASDCADGAACLGGRCGFDCVTDRDCTMPKSCGDETPLCQAAGFSCVLHECKSLTPSELSVLVPRSAPSQEGPLLTCGGNAFALYAYAAAQPCSTRACGEICVSCDGRSPTCRQQAGTCDAQGECVSAAPVCPLDGSAHPDGWDAPAGAGKAFIVNAIAVSSGSRGLDVDGKCNGGSCIDNALSVFGVLGNDQLRQGLLGGETLLLIEIAGIDEPYTGNDSSVTVKVYGARDADDPFFPANNFSVPAGEIECCKFKINPQSVSENMQAHTKLAGRIRNGILSTVTPGELDFALTVGVPPYPQIRASRVRMFARLTPSLGELQDLMVGGAVPISTFANLENPYCKTVNNVCPRPTPDSTFLELVASLVQPDIDLDVPPNGLDRFTGADGRITACSAACPDACTEIASPLASEPWRCQFDARLHDGFSVSLEGGAVAAQVVGVGF